MASTIPDSETIHATCVSIGGHGVLLTGPSGAGKSDVALRLIDRGAMLVSDDYTIITAGDCAPIAAPPPTIAGRIEIRGIGIVAFPYSAQVTVALVVELTQAVPRMPEPRTIMIAGHTVPLIALDGHEASCPIKVEHALDWLLRSADNG